MTSDERRAARPFGRVGLAAAIGAAIVLWLALSPLLAAPSSTQAPGLSHAQRFGARRGERQRNAVGEWFEPSRRRRRARDTGTSERRSRGVAGREAKRFAAGPSGSLPAVGRLEHGLAGCRHPSAHRARRSSATPLMKAALDRELGRCVRSSGSQERRPRSCSPTARCGPAHPGFADVAAAPAGHSRHAVRGREASRRRSRRRSSSRSPARAGSTSTRRC